MPHISIIVIGRNEERLLAHTLQAAQTAATIIGHADLVYVDSASTDKSVEIAKSVGVRILELRKDWDLSAAAGRYIGYHHTSGEFLLFIDGDTIVRPDFLPKALPYFQTENIAGLTGYLEDIDETGTPLPYVGQRCEQEVVAGWLRGGCSMYRRSALQDIGSFNPYLISEEEAELAVRLKRKGWELIEIPVPMACHLRGFKSANIGRSWRLGRFGSIGKTLRYAASDGNAFAFCQMRLKPTVFFLFVMGLFLAGITFLIEGRLLEGDAALFCFASALFAVAVKKRSVSGPLRYVSTHIATILDVTVGILNTKLKSSQTYPIDVLETLERKEVKTSEDH